MGGVEKNRGQNCAEDCARIARGALVVDEDVALLEGDDQPLEERLRLAYALARRLDRRVRRHEEQRARVLGPAVPV